jgi:hypothetical protein
MPDRERLLEAADLHGAAELALTALDIGLDAAASSPTRPIGYCINSALVFLTTV